MAETRFPIGLYEKAIPAASWPDLLRQARHAGYDYVEISIDETEERLARVTSPASERAALRQAIADAGVPIMTMCLSAHRKFPLGSASSDVRRRGLDLLRDAVRFAADIGLRIVQVMGYDAFYEPSTPDTRARFIEGLEMGARWAGQYGVMLGLENVDCEIADSISRMLGLIESVNSPWLQLMPDMGNLAAAGHVPERELRQAVGRLVGIHCKDVVPHVIRRIPFETGILSFSAVFATLAAVTFSGPMTVEMWADGDTTGDPIGAARAARSLVDRLILDAWSHQV
jgi:L-ribulose-5-phosphate 3-epimerase